MTESEFFAVTNHLLTMIETQVENADIDVDTSIEEGILELTFLDESQIIVNRHMINQEIWVAAKMGGVHYQFNGKVWSNTRTGANFLEELAKAISLQAQTAFSFIPETQE